MTDRVLGNSPQNWCGLREGLLEACCTYRPAPTWWRFHELARRRARFNSCEVSRAHWQAGSFALAHFSFFIAVAATSLSFCYDGSGKCDVFPLYLCRSLLHLPVINPNVTQPHASPPIFQLPDGAPSHIVTQTYSTRASGVFPSSDTLFLTKTRRPNSRFRRATCMHPVLLDSARLSILALLPCSSGRSWG